MPCRQSLCESFTEIKGVGEERGKERYREKEEKKEDARTTLPLQKGWEESQNGWSLSLKGTFAHAYIKYIHSE